MGLLAAPDFSFVLVFEIPFWKRQNQTSPMSWPQTVDDIYTSLHKLGKILLYVSTVSFEECVPLIIHFHFQIILDFINPMSSFYLGIVKFKRRSKTDWKSCLTFTLINMWYKKMIECVWHPNYNRTSKNSSLSNNKSNSILKLWWGCIKFGKRD